MARYKANGAGAHSPLDPDQLAEMNVLFQKAGWNPRPDPERPGRMLLTKPKWPLKGKKLTTKAWVHITDGLRAEGAMSGVRSFVVFPYFFSYTPQLTLYIYAPAQVFLNIITQRTESPQTKLVLKIKHAWR